MVGGKGTRRYIDPPASDDGMRGGCVCVGVCVCVCVCVYEREGEGERDGGGRKAAGLDLKGKCSRRNKPLRGCGENPQRVWDMHSKLHFADFKY